MYKINIHVHNGPDNVGFGDSETTGPLSIQDRDRCIRVWREGEKKGRREEGKKGLREPREISILHASMIYSTTTCIP